MSRFLLMIGLLSAQILPSHACLMFLEEATPASAPPLSLVEKLQQHDGEGIWQQRAAERQQIADKQWDFRTQNNLSVALAHLGRLDEALDRMKTIERTYPGQRETASNLGTVYELKGDLTQAKFWIAEGIRREEKSAGHASIDGTEWLHLRILDAKISHLNTSDLAQKAPISGVDFGSSRVPITPIYLPAGNSGAALTLNGVQSALQEQLHERLEFVKAPDPIAGDLLFDLGNSLSVAGDSDDARDVYQLALSFGTSQNSLAHRRLDYLDGTYAGRLQFALWSLGLAIVAGYFGHKKWREAQMWRAIPIEKFDDEPEKPFKTAYLDGSHFDPSSRD